MSAIIAGGIVLMFFGALVVWGERGQRWIESRRLRLHTCPTPCNESYWCRCGCSDGWTMSARQTSCGVCGTQIVEVDTDGAGEVTQELPHPGQTSWGWRREKQERIREALEWERKHGY
jgi:hypothetical protein